MTFAHPLYLPFLLAVLVAFAALGQARRWVVLLVASYAFCATWSPALPALLAGSDPGHAPVRADESLAMRGPRARGSTSCSG